MSKVENRDRVASQWKVRKNHINYKAETKIVAEEAVDKAIETLEMVELIEAKARIGAVSVLAARKAKNLAAKLEKLARELEALNGGIAKL